MNNQSNLKNKSIFGYLALWIILGILSIFSNPLFEGFDEYFHYNMSLNDDSSKSRIVYYLFYFIDSKFNCNVSENILNSNYHYFLNEYSYKHSKVDFFFYNYRFKIIFFLFYYFYCTYTVFFEKVGSKTLIGCAAIKIEVL